MRKQTKDDLNYYKDWRAISGILLLSMITLFIFSQIEINHLQKENEELKEQMSNYQGDYIIVFECRRSLRGTTFREIKGVFTFNNLKDYNLWYGFVNNESNCVLEGEK